MAPPWRPWMAKWRTSRLPRWTSQNSTEVGVVFVWLKKESILPSFWLLCVWIISVKSVATWWKIYGIPIPVRKWKPSWHCTIQKKRDFIRACWRASLFPSKVCVFRVQFESMCSTVSGKIRPESICIFISTWHKTWYNLLRCHPHTPGRYLGCFTNSLWRNSFFLGVWGSLGAHLPRGPVGKIIEIYRIQIPQTTSDFDPLKTIASCSPQKGRDPIQKEDNRPKKTSNLRRLKLRFPPGVYNKSNSRWHISPKFQSMQIHGDETSSRKAREVAFSTKSGCSIHWLSVAIAY